MVCVKYREVSFTICVGFLNEMFLNFDYFLEFHAHNIKLLLSKIYLSLLKNTLLFENIVITMKTDDGDINYYYYYIMRGSFRAHWV